MRVRRALPHLFECFFELRLGLPILRKFLPLAVHDGGGGTGDESLVREFGFQTGDLPVDAGELVRQPFPFFFEVDEVAERDIQRGGIGDDAHRVLRIIAVDEV